MRRRLIPPLIALAVFAVGFILSFSDELGETRADEIIIAVCAAVFAGKTALFLWMRHRMCTNPKGLTVFGKAIVDWFAFLALMAVILTYIFALLLYQTVTNDTSAYVFSHTVRVVNRLLLASSGVLVIIGGVAVAYEMKLAGMNLSVHIEREHIYAT